MADLSLDDKTDQELSAQVNSAKVVKRWVQEIKFYETKAFQWEEKGKKILRRYKDDRSPREQKVPRYNILWSNVQTLLPALYARRPKPDIERRFRDKDEDGKMASSVLERSIGYFINEEFDAAVKSAVFDRLLPGRGTVWVRYEPHFKDAEEGEGEDVQEETDGEGEEITDSASETNDGGGVEIEGEEPFEIVSDEVVAFDYVHWQDFGHTFGRTWDEVDAVWRKVYLTKEELVERFGEDIGNAVTLDYSPHDLKDSKNEEITKKATVYEIWAKGEKKAYWIHKDYQKAPLDEQKDPLELTDFFPCPTPLFATLANDTCIPVADYIEYQDQANELDELTSRIGAITKCVKVAGVHDASAAGIERLLAEGVENQTIPISQWAIFAEKGGMKGAIELLPMQEILQTLVGLYEARDKVKSDLYEITGIADIIRGASDANETATAQQIKSQFGTLRLSAQQDDVQRFVRDMVKIGTEIISKHFDIETIKKISGIELLTGEEKHIVQIRQQALQQYAAQQKFMQPEQPPLPPPQLPPLPNWLQKQDTEDMEELMENPTWEEVESLLHDEVRLSYKIDIETDSTLKFDQDAEQAARVQFLDASGKFLQSAMQNTNPDLAPLLAKLLMFGVRGFKVGKDLESAFEVAIHKLEKDAQNPQQKPNPEMMKIQAQVQADKEKMQFDGQLEQQRMQNDAALEKMKSDAEDKRLSLQAQNNAQEAQMDNQLEQTKLKIQDSFERWKAQLESETRIAVAQIQAKAQLQNTALAKEDGGVGLDENGNANKQPQMADLMTTVVDQLKAALDNNAQVIAQSHAVLAQALTNPNAPASR